MKKNDIILIVSILLISVIAIFAIRITKKEYDNKTVVIYADGQKVYESAMADIADEKRISFKFGENIGYLNIENGAVRMEEMDRKICPEKICSDTGWISESYETIVCLPNKIAVRFEGGAASDIVDEVAF